MTPARLLMLTLVMALSVGRISTAAPIRIAYSSISGAMLPLWVAKDKRLFDKHSVEGVKGLLKGLGSEGANVNPVNFVDASLVQELEKEGLSQQKSR